MHFKILFCLLATSLAAPQFPGYNLPTPGFRTRTGGDGSSSSGGSGIACSSADGSCGEPEISRKAYIFVAPEQQVNRQIDPTPPPKPRLNYNIVFVRTPEGPEGYEPVVIPPAQQKTIVYVLTEDGEDTGPQVIEMPDGLALPPEVFYLNYKEGDNPQLPIGVDLQTALASAVSEQGQLVQVGDGSGSIGGGSNLGISSGGALGGRIGGAGSLSGNGGLISGRGNQGGYTLPNPQPPSNVYGTPLSG